MDKTPTPTMEGWSVRDEVPDLAPGHIHVWSWDLHVRGEVQVLLQGVLSADEQARAARFHFQRHRDEFIVARGTLREILAGYLKTSPERTLFSYTPFGKPWVSNSQVRFNLSHAGNRAVLAVCSGTSVGIDLEKTWLPPEADELAGVFFSTGERQLFSSLGQEEKPEAFMNLWTRKEAWLKATGEGISHYLKDVEVTFASKEAPRLVKVSVPHYSSEDWALYEVAPIQGYSCSLAARTCAAEVQCWKWRQT